MKPWKVVTGSDGCVTSSIGIWPTFDTARRSFSVSYGRVVRNAALIVWLGVVSSSV